MSATETKTDTLFRRLAEGATYAQIAEELGTSVGSLRVLAWKRRNPEKAVAAARTDWTRHTAKRQEYQRKWRKHRLETQPEVVKAARRAEHKRRLVREVLGSGDAA